MKNFGPNHLHDLGDTSKEPLIDHESWPLILCMRRHFTFKKTTKFFLIHPQPKTG